MHSPGDPSPFEVGRIDRPSPTHAVAYGPLPRCGLGDLLNAPANPIAHARSLPTGLSRKIALPPLLTGRHLLAHAKLTEYPPDAHWANADYDSVTPWICQFREVAVFGDGGIVVADGAVVSDTLAHCEQGRQWFADRPDGVTLYTAAPPKRLDGVWLSLLGGGHWNYYHWMVDGLGRLAGADPAILAECTGVLLPAHPIGVAAETLARTGIARGRLVHHVEPWEAFSCARLVVPWAMAAMFRPHPHLVGFLAGLVPQRPLGQRRRLYIDRRAASNRRLANEPEVIAALARFGVEPVTLEGKGLAEQAALFADAELVVAPHGAGLVNLVFAPRDCRVVEMLSEDYVHWCYRHLAAAAGLAYDCVIGRTLPGDDAASVHSRGWMVAPTHVQAAVAAALA